MIATFYDFFFLSYYYCCFTQIIVLLITVNQLFLSNSLNTHLQLRYYLVHRRISYQIVFFRFIIYLKFLYIGFFIWSKKNIAKYGKIESWNNFPCNLPTCRFFFHIVQLEKKVVFSTRYHIYHNIGMCLFMCRYVCSMYVLLTFFCRSVVGGVWNLYVQGIEIQTTIMQ
jgi:hypothetical protein